MDLSIIVLNYNGKSWLEQLLPTLREQFLNRTTRQVEVVVVDNASTDGSLNFLENQADVRLIRSDVNGGYAAGNNLALKDNTARYLMLLNSDTEFLPGMSDLDSLLDFMDTVKTVGILTPRVQLDDGTLDQACHRGEPTPWASFTYFCGLERLFPSCSLLGQYHLTHLPIGEIHDIDACTGAAMIIRRSAMQEVGLLDERFFMYAEDLDWCKRFREAGYRIVYHPGATILHHKYRSGLRHEDVTHRNETRFWFYETMLQYYDKHYRKKGLDLFRLALKAFIRSRKGR